MKSLVMHDGGANGGIHMVHHCIVLQARCPACRPTNSLRALKEMPRTFLDGVLHPLCLLSHASTGKHNITQLFYIFTADICISPMITREMCKSVL